MGFFGREAQPIGLAVCVFASLPKDMQTAMKNKTIKGSHSLRSDFSNLKDDSSPLSVMICNTTERWYNAKHPSICPDELHLINSLPRRPCPYCGSRLVKKDGKRKDGIQIYKCLSCKRRFNPLTGTPFDSRRIPISEWIEFLVHVFQYESINVSALDNRNTESTGIYWLRKVFAVLKDYQDRIVLGPVFWIDETFLHKKPSETRKDAKGRKLRGLSNDTICIETATDGKNSVLFAIGNGKPSKRRILDAMDGHIIPNSRMIDDGEGTHQALVARYKLTREIHLSLETKGLADNKNPMEPINTLHRYFKRFIAHHGSYDRDRVQDWCNLFSFMYNHGGNVPEMVESFLKRALSTYETLRYRDVMSKKEEKDT